MNILKKVKSKIVRPGRQSGLNTSSNIDKNGGNHIGVKTEPAPDPNTKERNLRFTPSVQTTTQLPVGQAADKSQRRDVRTAHTNPQGYYDPSKMIGISREISQKQYEEIRISQMPGNLQTIKRMADLVHKHARIERPAIESYKKIKNAQSKPAYVQDYLDIESARLKEMRKLAKLFKGITLEKAGEYKQNGHIQSMPQVGALMKKFKSLLDQDSVVMGMEHIAMNDEAAFITSAKNQSSILLQGEDAYDTDVITGKKAPKVDTSAPTLDRVVTNEGIPDVMANRLG